MKFRSFATGRQLNELAGVMERAARVGHERGATWGKGWALGRVQLISGRGLRSRAKTDLARGGILDMVLTGN